MNYEYKTQVSDSFINSVILALSGGLQDAYTYNVRSEVFANAQTGNIVLMSQNLMSGKWTNAVEYIIPLIAFALGIFAAERFSYHLRSSNILHWRQWVLIIEMSILFAVGFLPHSMDLLASAMVSLSCAMQVQSFRKVNGYKYSSTMCIGNLRAGTEALSKYFREKSSESLASSLHYFGIILTFAIGAGIGALHQPRNFSNLGIMYSSDGKHPADVQREHITFDKLLFYKTPLGYIYMVKLYR